MYFLCSSFDSSKFSFPLTDQPIIGYVSGSNSRGSLESSSYGYKKQEETKEIGIEEEEKKTKDECYSVRVFSFNDLKAATRNFRPDSFLGQGGFGSVFKGWIDEKTFKAVAPGSGIQIAVKQLDNEGSQGDKEWMVCLNDFCYAVIIFNVVIIVLICLLSNLLFFVHANLVVVICHL